MIGDLHRWFSVSEPASAAVTDNPRTDVVSRQYERYTYPPNRYKISRHDLVRLTDTRTGSAVPPNVKQKVIPER